MDNNEVNEWMLLIDIELAKLDKSGFGYKRVRENLPDYLKYMGTVREEVLEFIADEMSRENPFYPNSGRQKVTDEVMQRSMEFGMKVELMRMEKPHLSVKEQIIPMIAKEAGMSKSTIWQDYNKRVGPIIITAMNRASEITAKDNPE